MTNPVSTTGTNTYNYTGSKETVTIGTSGYYDITAEARREAAAACERQPRDLARWRAARFTSLPGRN